MLYVAIGAGSVVPIAIAFALFIAFRRRADIDTLANGEIAAVRADKKNKTARRLPWKAGTGKANRTSLDVVSFEADNPRSSFSEEGFEGGDQMTPLSATSRAPPPLPPMAVKTRAPPPFSTYISSLTRSKSASSRPKSAGIMSDEQVEELTEFLRGRDNKLKTDRQLRLKVQKLAMYQRSDLIRALTKLYGAVPESMESDRDSLNFE